MAPALPGERCEARDKQGEPSTDEGLTTSEPDPLNAKRDEEAYEALKFLMSGGVIGRDPERPPALPTLPWQTGGGSAGGPQGSGDEESANS